MQRLVDYQQKHFSQSGEDGIIQRVFDVIGASERFCCEFGAWDGLHLSNTRSLILDGWSALLIEACPERFQQLRRTYLSNEQVVCVNAAVGTKCNNLADILKSTGLAKRRLDLLSIDIDGLDFDHFSALDDLDHRPRLVVVEVQPEHGPDRTELLPAKTARRNVGQPLAAFVRRGNELGYRLVCYFGGNAFFLANDAGAQAELPTITAAQGWADWYSAVTNKDANYLFERNVGLHGGYRFNNPKLSASALGIPKWRATKCTIKSIGRRLRSFR